jgi:drug/metabolite transporter (DMT)-like permease
MTALIKTILISIIMVVLLALGDYYVKKASMLKEYTGWHFLLLGTSSYFVSAFGLFWVYRSYKFVTVGAIQSFGIVVLSVLLSVFVFKEKMNGWEIFGLILGIISLAILLYNGKL